MQSIEYNIENYSILSQNYKKIIIFQVPAHIGNKGKEEADKTTKQAMDVPGMTTKKNTF